MKKNKTEEQIASEIIEMMQQAGLSPDEMLEVIALTREKFNYKVEINLVCGTDNDGNCIRVGDKVKGEGFLECQDGFKIDRSPVVTVSINEKGEVMFGQLSAKSFPRFWVVNE